MEDPTLAKFDFNEMVCQARIGYAELSTRHAALLELIASSTSEAQTVQEQITKLAAMLKNLGVEPEESLARPRSANVATATKKAVTLAFGPNTSLIIRESDLIAAVKADGNPSMLDKSIQGALYKLSVAGWLTRHGKRGSDSYSLAEVEDGPVVAPEVLPEPPFVIVHNTAPVPAGGNVFPRTSHNGSNEARPNWDGGGRS